MTEWYDKMKMIELRIEGIPAIIWGENTDCVFIAVHGNMSNKADVPIQLLAEAVVEKGHQVLSFDLPEHGDRKEEGSPCKVQNCVKDLLTIMQYAKSRWKEISLFANSIGAFFSLLTYKDENLKLCLFLSPVIDMERIIENMMKWFQVSPERLKAEKEIDTPIGQKLYWDYYCYVKENPIRKWDVSTNILCGECDEICENKTVLDFSRRFCCSLEVMKKGEHYFHTAEQLQVLKNWLIASTNSML